MNKEPLKLAKATIYVSGRFGFSATEVHDLEISFGKYAQYPEALHASWRLPRARSRKGIKQGNPCLVAIEGWNHEVPIPDAMADEGGVTATRHASFSVEYDKEFDAALKKYLEQSPEMKVHDYRQVEHK